MSISERIRTYFLGSGRLGVPVLKALAAACELSLVGVGTQPDRPQGRQRHLGPTAIGRLATDLGFSPDKPAGVNAPEFLASLRALQPDLVVVVSYGQILKEEILSLCPYGCLNVHASLLPRFRGAAPVQAAILAGDAETGVSFMKIDRGLDTGPVYEQVRLALHGAETDQELEDRLGELAAQHVVRCIRRICRDGLQPVPQPSAGVILARKLKKTDGRLSWAEDAFQLERRVRAYTPWPGAWFELPTPKGVRRILITRGEVVPPGTGGGTPGMVLQTDPHAWVIACGQHALRLVRIVPEGRPEMSAAEFLRGCHLEPGTRLP